jgi:UDP-3-O-[3-hydroxymyristoyl] glucosamine N-acyltransferase
MHYRSLSYSVQSLADAAQAKPLGDTSIQISNLSSIETPQPDTVTFIRADSAELVAKRIATLPTPMVVVVPEKAAPSAIPTGIALLLAKESYSAFLNLVPLFFEEPKFEPGIHPSAVIHPTAAVHPTASVGAYCSVGARTVIGRNSVLLPNVNVYEDVSIGDSVTIHCGASIRSHTVINARVTIHNNAVIGADGFGYTPDPAVGLRKVPQVGNVIIGSDVEIGANTCIDRGAFGPTTIGRGTKIDNLVQIGHNTSVGEFCIICGQAAIAGSVKIGPKVVVGGSAGIANHLEIVSGVRLGGWAGVTSNLLEPGDYMGFPAIKATEWRRTQVQLRRLYKDSRKTRKEPS